MKTVLNAMIAIHRHRSAYLNQYTGLRGRGNRANNLGDFLEMYIKDAICDTYHIVDPALKLNAYRQEFSFLGNSNNPPDMMIQGGDAIEIKKLEREAQYISLNSSYPKDYLYNTTPLITQACIACENWTKKDMLYVVGLCDNLQVTKLWFVYGNCFAADRFVYESKKSMIQNGISAINGINFSQTRELGRVNGVDPLGYTYLRIRGMWGIRNPLQVFNYNGNSNFVVRAVMLIEKYLSIPDSIRDEVQGLHNPSATVANISIPDPNNPARVLDGVQITIAF